MHFRTDLRAVLKVHAAFLGAMFKSTKDHVASLRAVFKSIKVMLHIESSVEMSDCSSESRRKINISIGSNKHQSNDQKFYFS